MEQQCASAKKIQSTSFCNDNYLTTNFNTATPKTYRLVAPYVPPIPNVDLPKVNFTKTANPNNNKTVLNSSSVCKVNMTIPLIPPPLPVAPKLIPKYSNNHGTLGIPVECAPIPKSNFLPETGPQLKANDVPSFATKLSSPIVPPLPVTAPLIVNPVLPPPSQHQHNYFSYYAESEKIGVPSTSALNYQASQNLGSPLQLTATSAALNQNSNSQASSRKPPAKVKFSDTVTAFIVPEIRRPVRPPPPPHVTDPQKELADSLPLCHPNEDYLKDFTPVQKNEAAEATNQPKIKVVHFGVV